MKVKMFRKSGLMVLAATLALSVATTGCGTKKTVGETSKATPNTAQSTVNNTPMDLTVSLYDRGNIPAAEGTADNTRWTKWMQETMKKDYNVNIKFVVIPRWESIQKYNLLFAANDAPEFITEYDAAFRGQLYANKQIQPIGDALTKSKEYKALFDQYPAMKKMSTREDGKMYDLIRVNGLGPNHVLVIRNDWLKALNLSAPKTAEDYFDVAKAFTEQDPDKNGKKDTYGTALSFITGYILDSAFANANWVLKDDQVTFATEQMKASIDFKKKIYDAGLTDKDFALDKNGAKAQEDFIKGKTGIYGASLYLQGAYNVFYEALKKNVPTAELTVIAAPQTQFGSFGPTINLPIQPFGVVNKSCKNLETVMKYMDFMSKESTYTTLKFGTEGVYSKKGANGAFAAIDPVKSKAEVDYNTDIIVPSSSATYKFWQPKNALDETNAGQKEYINLLKQMETICLDGSKPMPNWLSPELMPALSQDLVVINNALLKANDGKKDEVTTKAIISGTSYTTDKAMKDWQDAWDKNGGQKLMEFYNKWYKDNKANLITWKEIYSTK